MEMTDLHSGGRRQVPRERLSVVVTRRLPEPVETRLSELFDVRLRTDDTPMTRTELAAAMKEADVLVPTVTDTIDAGLLGQAGERLRLIANYGAGVDNIDVATARQRGILVSNTPGVLTDDTADMTMALIMAVVRRIPEGLAIMQRGDWEGWSPTAPTRQAWLATYGPPAVQAAVAADPDLPLKFVEYDWALNGVE